MKIVPFTLLTCPFSFLFWNSPLSLLGISRRYKLKLVKQQYRACSDCVDEQAGLVLYRCQIISVPGGKSLRLATKRWFFHNSCIYSFYGLSYLVQYVNLNRPWTVQWPLTINFTSNKDMCCFVNCFVNNLLVVNNLTVLYC